MGCRRLEAWTGILDPLRPCIIDAGNPPFALPILSAWIYIFLAYGLMHLCGA